MKKNSKIDEKKLYCYRMWSIILFCGIAAAEKVIQTDLDAGIYKEPLGNVVLLEKKVEIWVKLNLTELSEEIKNLDEFKAVIEHYCYRKSYLQNNVHEACSSFIEMSGEMIKVLDEKFEKLSWERRSKRGLMNFVGTGMRYLFGTLDNDDREVIRGKLDGLAEENLNNVKFNFEYAQLIEKTIASVNTTISSCNRNGRLLTGVHNQLRVLSTDLQNIEKQLAYSNLLEEMKNAFIIMFAEIEARLGETHQMLVDFHNNILNTRIIGYGEIINGLKKVTVKDAKMKMAVDLSQPDLEVLRKLLKFAVLKGNDTLVVVFMMPLIEIEEYKLFKLYPIPKLSGKIATYLDVTDKMILTDSHFERFATIEDMKVCKEITEKYYCEDINVLSKNREACEIKALSENARNLEKNCGIKMVKIERITFVKTMSKNRFLTFATEAEYGKLITKDGFQNLVFNGTQTLEIKENAKLYLEELEIKFQNDNYKTEVEARLSTKIKVKMESFKWEDKESLIPNFENPMLLDNEEFNDLGVKSHELTRKLEERIKSKKTEKNSNWSLYLFGGLVTVLVSASAG